jgi:hypothetical protein
MSRSSYENIAANNIFRFIITVVVVFFVVVLPSSACHAKQSLDDLY